MKKKISDQDKKDWKKFIDSNVKLVNGKDKLAVLHKRQMSGVNAERIEKSNVYAVPPNNDDKVYSLKVGLTILLFELFVLL